MQVRDKVLRFAEQSLRIFNEPLVADGEFTRAEMDEEVRFRVALLGKMNDDALMDCLLDSLPDECFRYA